ncbi:MAG: glycosyltransferase family 4 protein [Actinomycetota bacterium]
MSTAPPGLLRVLFIFHESESLGAGRAVLGTVDRLREYGWTPSAWLPGEGPFVVEVEAAVADCVVVPKPLAYSIRGWRSGDGVAARIGATKPYLQRLREELTRLRPHVVHANTLRSLPEAAIARSLGLPVVMHVHELPEPGVKTTLAMRSAARVADVLVGVSEAVSARLREHAGSTPVLTVQNGVPPLSPFAREPQAGLVGTVGTICRAKGTDVFVEAAALALERKPELRFEHIGQSGLDHDSEFARDIEDRVAAPRLREQLRLLGRRPAEEGLARWETFVLTSRTDAFPLATLEAMQAGVPVVAADVGGVPEQIVHLESGILVPPERPDLFADWIVRLAEDAPLRDRLAQGGAERVRARFDRHRQAQGLHRAYLAALNLRYAPPPARRATLEAL